MSRRRPGNIRHGQKRRMPWSIRLPVTILIIQILILLVLLPAFIEKVMGR